jgi:hypothetical protein
MPVIMMSGHATIDTAVEATKIGAQSFLEKPITLQKLLKAVEHGLARNGPPQARARPMPWPGRPDGRSRHDRRAQPAPRGGNGPPARQMFELDKPLRDARDEFEKSYFEFHLGQRGRIHDPRGRKDRGWSAPTCTASSNSWAWTCRGANAAAS